MQLAEEGVTAEAGRGPELRKGIGGRFASALRGANHGLGRWSAAISTFLIASWLIASLLLGCSTNVPTDLSAYPWLFLRGDGPIASDEDLVEVLFVGDVMLGRGLADGPTPFTEASPWLRAADLSVANLECVVTADLPAGRGAERGGQPGPLIAPPEAVEMLRGAGFDLLGLANNHSMDLGPDGLGETISRLSAAGMTAFGVRSEADSEIRPLMTDVRGVRLAFLGFNAIPGGATSEASGLSIASWDPAQARAAVGQAANGADGVVVSIHWGYEYDRRVDPIQRRAAELLFEAGADLVVGHHPHVVQGFGVDNGRAVAYSLGNFVFDQGGHGTGRGLALRAFFDEDGLRAVQGLPVHVGRRPSLAGLGEASSMLPATPDGRERKAFVCTETTCRPAEGLDDCEQKLPSAIFWGGRVDLTGDGVPEHVRRVDDSVIIYSDGQEAWRSPDAWRVEDVAAGDPNDDGRSELMLALWKPGLDGLEPASAWKEQTPRSRPFIIGYRGGVYRTLWGGSAVSDPIHEVALGDVDGDGAEELLVLEAPEKDSPERRLAVWRWHGWGFSLMWRSEADRFSDLVVDASGTIHVKAPSGKDSRGR